MGFYGYRVRDGLGAVKKNRQFLNMGCQIWAVAIFSKLEIVWVI